MFLPIVFGEGDTTETDFPNKISGTLDNPLSTRTDLTSIAGIFGFVTNLLITIGWGLVLVFLALGFIKYVTSQGEKTNTQNAQQMLTYAVIGGVGLLAISLIKAIVGGILGIDVKY